MLATFPCFCWKFQLELLHYSVLLLIECVHLAAAEDDHKGAQVFLLYRLTGVQSGLHLHVANQRHHTVPERDPLETRLQITRVHAALPEVSIQELSSVHLIINEVEHNSKENMCIKLTSVVLLICVPSS